MEIAQAGLAMGRPMTTPPGLDSAKVVILTHRLRVESLRRLRSVPRGGGRHGATVEAVEEIRREFVAPLRGGPAR
jgi:hypothetical protein